MKRIIYTRPDGGIDIVGIPATLAQLRQVPRLRNMTQAEYELHIWERSVPSFAINPQFLDFDGLDEGLKKIIIGVTKEERYFRDAIKQYGKKAVVDMDKAKEIHMNKIRAARNKKLKELDESQYGSDFDEERDVLRDLPKTFDLTAETPEELKALWPDELKEK